MIAQLNILKTAFKIIPHDAIKYCKFVSKNVTDFGITNQVFSEEKSISAIVQPGIVSSFGGKCIELKDYKDMGLDWSKRYITVWLPYVGLEPPTDRDGADRIIHEGKTFSVLQVENWGSYTGYQRCYCVEIKPE